MDLSIRIPDALDLTAYRLAVGDTTAMITKISGTQAALEQYSTTLNDYTADLLALADAVEAARIETVQTANSVNLPNAGSAPGSWLQSQPDGSYALRGITHQHIGGLGQHYLSNAALTDGQPVRWNAEEGRAVSAPVQWSEVQQKPDLLIKTALTDGQPVRWNEEEGRAVSAPVQWSEVQEKPELLIKTALTDGQPVRWNEEEGKAVSAPIRWSEVQQTPDFDLSALVSTGSAITRNQDGFIASITDQVGGHERIQTLNYSNGQLTSIIIDYNNTSQTYSINRDAAGRISGVIAL